MRRLRLLEPARREFLAQVEIYKEVDSGVADRFIAAVSDTFQRLQQFPLSGAPIDHQTRRMVVQRFPFVIYYFPLTSEILVVAVAHRTRRPGYWTSPPRR